MLANVTQYMDMILKFADICVIAYASYKFLRKPQNTLSNKVAELEEKIEKLQTECDMRQREIEQQLRQGNDKFRSHENILEVLLTCTLALINFEVHYCETEHKDISQDLADARKELNKCLSKISKEENT